MTDNMKSSDSRDEAVSLVRSLLQRSTGSSAANDSRPTPKEFQAARNRVHLSFGQALLCIATIPSVASVSPHLDTAWNFIFGGFGLTLALVGAYYIDRAIASDKAILSAK
jgi:hypothetical protein